MKVLSTIAHARETVCEAKKANKTIGLVLTMGALHAGHMALVNEAKKHCDFVAVSIFVNPTQFGEGEDFDKYPRTLEEDAKKCEAAGCDMIFAPPASEMYPKDYDTYVECGGITQILEAKTRPTHFRGVTSVCAKLFNIITPDKAFFGKKDYQQLCVIKKMVKELNMPLEIIAVDIVRGNDGLALSSRNKYLSDKEHAAALSISGSLYGVKEKYIAGERDLNVLKGFVSDTIQSEPIMRIDYVEIVDADTLGKVCSNTKQIVVLVAAYAGKTRLIDNILL